MPRGIRRISKTGVYHIMMRGNEKRNIFIDKWDKRKFIDILNKIKAEEDYELFAYCIMPNHVHLVIKENTSSISQIMRRINTSYAQYFNTKYERVGHVFQDRFKSEVIENDAYLLCAIRYIHNNPVKAKMVKKPIDYGWSSYKEYVKKEESIIDRDFTLSLYSEDIDQAIILFKNFTLKRNTDKFLDLDDDLDDKDLLHTTEECIEYIDDICKKYNTSLCNIVNLNSYRYIRKELILHLRNNSKLSLRELEVILGLSRSTISRT